jgi:hypothetical protein
MTKRKEQPTTSSREETILALELHQASADPPDIGKTETVKLKVST